MSILTLVASTPQINSLRRANDFLSECKRLGLKIVPDETKAATAAKLCKCGDREITSIRKTIPPWASTGDQ